MIRDSGAGVGEGAPEAPLGAEAHGRDLRRSLPLLFLIGSSPTSDSPPETPLLGEEGPTLETPLYTYFSNDPSYEP